MKVEVIRKTLKYDRARHAVGEQLEMSEKDARVFIALNRVQAASTTVSAASDIPAAPAPISLVTRGFDHPGLDAPDSDGMELLGGLSADAAAPAAADSVARDTSDTAATKPNANASKRVYERRDMKAGK